MPHFTFEELAQVAAVPTATLNRRLKFIKTNAPATYASMLLKEGRQKTYNSEVVLPILTNWKAYAGRFEKSTPEPEPEVKNVVRVARVNKPRTKAPPLPKDEQRQKKLTELAETPLVILQPDQATLNLYKSITDPILRERVEYTIEICDKYSKGDVSLDDACRSIGIAYRTFKSWLDKHAELATLYKKARVKARRNRAAEIGEAAQFALLDAVRGGEWDEVTTIMQHHLQPDGSIKEVPISSRIVRKKQPASVQAIMFALTNAMNRIYKNRFQQDLGPTPEQLRKDEIDKMSPEERHEQLMKMLEQRMIEQGWTPPTKI